MSLTALSRFGHIPMERFFFFQVMSIPLFPEATGFVEECLESVGIMPEDSITNHQLLELVIHVQGRLCSEKQKGIDFCGLLSGMLQNVPTEDGRMRVVWKGVLRMLKTYRESVDTAQKKRQFVWSSENQIIMKLYVVVHRPDEARRRNAIRHRR